MPRDCDSISLGVFKMPPSFPCESQAQVGLGTPRGAHELFLGALIVWHRRTKIVLSYSFLLLDGCLCPPKICMLNPKPNAMVLGGGAVGRWSGLEGGDLMIGTGVLIKETPGLSILPSCKDTVRRRPSLNQEAVSQQTLNLPATWSWTSQWPEQQAIHFCCL